MDHRQLSLLAAALLIITFYFGIPLNKQWFKDHILNFTDDIYEEINYMDPEVRKEYRWAASYVMTKSIKETIEKHKIDSPLILTPPDKYYKKYNAELIIPEPVVFYYYSGLRTTMIGAKDVYKANFGIIYEGNTMKLVPLNNREQIQHVIDIYNGKQ